MAAQVAERVAELNRILLSLKERAILVFTIYNHPMITPNVKDDAWEKICIIGDRLMTVTRDLLKVLADHTNKVVALVAQRLIMDELVFVTEDVANRYFPFVVRGRPERREFTAVLHPDGFMHTHDLPNYHVCGLAPGTRPGTFVRTFVSLRAPVLRDEFKSK
jgi:hypothetical protein